MKITVPLPFVRSISNKERSPSLLVHSVSFVIFFGHVDFCLFDFQDFRFLILVCLAVFLKNLLLPSAGKMWRCRLYISNWNIICKEVYIIIFAGPNGRSPVEIVGSNPTGVMDVCLLRVLCVVRWGFVLRADHASRGVPRSVCPLRVISKPRNLGRDPEWFEAPQKKLSFSNSRL